MNTITTVLRTLESEISRYDFQKAVDFFEGDKRVFAFLTNDFTRTAQEIADMYRERWGIELFFTWLKQNLKIKTFWGTSRNAVLSQIRIALIVYLLIRIMKMKNLVDYSLQRIRQILKTTLLDKIPLDSLLRPPPERLPMPPQFDIF